MWDTFDQVMQFSMMVTVFTQILAVFQKFIDAITGAWDALFPSDPPVT